MYLFIICTPYSGSTLLWRIIKSSPNVSSLPKEGAQLISLGRATFEFVESPDLSFPWETAAEEWTQRWNADKPILLEKSPAYIHQADKISKYFGPVKFIVLIRNPYAFCEGNVRRRRRQGRLNYSYERSAKLWVRLAQSQRQNIRQLKNSVLVRYEDLTERTETTLERLEDAIPKLGHLNWESTKTFTVMGRTTEIRNVNAAKIKMLSPQNIANINKVLSKHKKLLSYYKYDTLNGNDISSVAVMMHRTAVKSVRFAKWLSRHNLLSKGIAKKISEIVNK